MHRLLQCRGSGRWSPIQSLAAIALVSSACGSALAGDGAPVRPFRIVMDAVPESLSGAAGDVARGRAIVANRQVGLCLLCHSGPIAEVRFQGDLAPNLAGAGVRWSEGQLRLRIADARKINPASIMPSYYRTDNLTRVTAAWAGQPILDAQQIEDVVAYLKALRD